MKKKRNNNTMRIPVTLFYKTYVVPVGGRHAALSLDMLSSLPLVCSKSEQKANKLK